MTIPRVVRRLAAASVLLAGTLAAHPHGQSQQPTPFRSGTNVVRVDATVIDRSGRPVASLTADDFEIREDDAIQPITSFTFLANSGQPSDDRSLPIRSQQHAAAEAARDDVRVFLIFWDEYHIGRFENALRAREALSRIVLTAFGPTDLVAIMDPLTPSSAIEFTRDRRSLADHIHRLEGRKGVYLPPRSAAEEAQLEAVNWLPEAVEPLRRQVTSTAIQAAVAHLGTLRDGRKTMVVVTEGFGVAPAGPAVNLRGTMGRYVDDQNTALTIVRTANNSNTAVHVIDPRGLQVTGGMDAMLETLAYGSGGELHRTNDMGTAIDRIVAQTTATYLLGYTREVAQDGRFHQIKVRVKRGGYDVRARAGYWAPKAADIERAKTAAAAAVLPGPIAAAFASLTPASSSRLIEVWTATWPVAEGRSLLTVAWTPLPGTPGDPVAASVRVTLNEPGAEVVEKVVEPAGTTFEVSGPVQLSFRVLDKAGEILDRETRSVAPAPADAALALAATVHLARTPAEMRALSTGTPPVYAGREFVRSDRLLIRIRAFGTSAAGAEITGRLIDRRGATLVPLAVGGPANGFYQVDLPLASIAAGDFAVVLEGRSGDARAEAIVPLRVRR